MDKRPLQKIDMIPLWIREALMEETPEATPKAEPPTSHEFRVPNIGGVEPSERKIAAELYKDPGGQAVVQLVWKGATSPIFEFSKKYSTWKDAEMVFSSLLSELKKVESYIDVDPGRAKENVEKLLDEYRGKSDTPHAGAEVGTKTMSVLEIDNGWNIISKQGKLEVSFSDDFLKKALSRFNPINDTPVNLSEQVYSTSSRQHCGTDNFVVSYWKKVNTSEGNIIRNAALVSRIGGSSYFVSGITVDEYNTLCTALTPNPKHYGIAYDSVTSSWFRDQVDIKASAKEVVAMVVERLSGSPEEIAEYDKLKKNKEDAPMTDMPKDEKSPKEDEEESLPLSDAEATAPLPESGEPPAEDKNLEQDLAEMIGLTKKAESK